MCFINFVVYGLWGITFPGSSCSRHLTVIQLYSICFICSLLVYQTGWLQESGGQTLPVLVPKKYHIWKVLLPYKTQCVTTKTVFGKSVGFLLPSNTFTFNILKFICDSVFIIFFQNLVKTCEIILIFQSRPTHFDEVLALCVRAPPLLVYNGIIVDFFPWLIFYYSDRSNTVSFKRVTYRIEIFFKEL